MHKSFSNLHSIKEFSLHSCQIASCLAFVLRFGFSVCRGASFTGGSAAVQVGLGDDDFVHVTALLLIFAILEI